MAAVVLVPDVIPEKGTLVAGTVEVQVGATPVPADVKNCPLVPAVLPGMRAPENWTLPVTSSFCPGAVVPMPTLPVLSITTLLFAKAEPPV